jgi:hypothetical protein
MIFVGVVVAVFVAAVGELLLLQADRVSRSNAAANLRFIEQPSSADRRTT